MPDLSLYKVDLDTPQPSGRTGESPRAAFTKYNEALEEIEGGFVPAEAGKGLSTHDYDNTAKQKVDEMGTAASRDIVASPTDVTAGKVVTVGYGGIGRIISPLQLDYNAQLPSGMYIFSNTATPSPGVGTRAVLNLVSADNTGVQIAGRAINNQISIRSVNGASADPFVDLYHTGNAVAPVSQSGGVLTGGLMQYGETPNGKFWRYANNHQVCVGSVTFENVSVAVTVGGGFQSQDSFVLNFAAPFSARPDVTPIARYVSGQSRPWASIAALTQSLTSVIMHSFVTISGGQITVHYIAEGPWY